MKEFDLYHNVSPNTHILKYFYNFIMCWLLLAIALLVFSFLGDKRLNRNKSYLIFRFLLVVSLSIIPGFGGLVAQDHDNYLKTFLLADFDLLFSFVYIPGVSSEPGFILLNILAKIMSLGIAGYFFFMSFLINYFIVIFSYRFSFPLISLLIFIISGYYFQEANLVRQMLSIGICMCSVKYFNKHTLSKYLGCLLLAATIHKSALLFLIFIPFLYFDYVRHYKKIKLVFFFLWILSFAFLLGILPFNFFIDLLIGSGPLAELYSTYITLDNAVGSESKFSIIYFYNLFFVIVAFCSKPHKHHICFIYSFLGSILTNISFVFPNAFRVALYFMVPFSLFIPYICRRTKSYHFLNYTQVFILYASYIVYNCYIFFFKFILGNQILGSKMYSFSLFLN